jgi:hypothetical protein
MRQVNHTSQASRRMEGIQESEASQEVKVNQCRQASHRRQENQCLEANLMMLHDKTKQLC